MVQDVSLEFVRAENCKKLVVLEAMKYLALLGCNVGKKTTAKVQA
jgi:hypothetical protein